MKYIHVIILFTFLFTGIFGTQFAKSQNLALKSDQILCEAPGQLTWFIGLSGISDLRNADQSSKYETSNEVPIKAYNKKAQKALRENWCVSTNNMSSFSAEVLEDCTEGFFGFPLPNGGCKKIRVKPVTPEGEDPNWTTWYTFGDSVVKDDQ